LSVAKAPSRLDDNQDINVDMEGWESGSIDEDGIEELDAGDIGPIDTLPNPGRLPNLFHQKMSQPFCPHSPWVSFVVVQMIQTGVKRKVKIRIWNQGRTGVVKEHDERESTFQLLLILGSIFPYVL